MSVRSGIVVLPLKCSRELEDLLQYQSSKITRSCETRERVTTVIARSNGNVLVEVILYEFFIYE